MFSCDLFFRWTMLSGRVILFLGLVNLVSCRWQPGSASLTAYREGPIRATVSPDSLVAWPFTRMEGYTTAQEILPFLQGEKLAAAPTGGWAGQDTVGKYYAFDTPDHVLFCRQEDDDVVLLELKNKNGYIHLENIGRYPHGNYDCCWEGYDGFVKYGEIFGLKICATGSAYCGSWLFLFKDLGSVYNEGGIQLSSRSGYGNDMAHVCTSSVKKVPEGLAVTYRCREEKRKREIWRPRSKETSYSVLYRHTPTGWKTDDSARARIEKGLKY